MSDQKNYWGREEPSGAAPSAPAGQRRLSRVVHDERGNARVEWIEESAGKLLGDRVALEIVDDGVDGRGTMTFNPRKVERGWNPYEQVGKSRAAPAPDAGSTSIRKDLRKLGEWIKLKRELEERKARGEE
jgi:hypothetical protein